MSADRVVRRIEPGNGHTADAPWPHNYLGTGVFETMKAQPAGAGAYFIAGFMRHCDRFTHSSNFFGLPVVSREQLYQAVTECLDHRSSTEAATVRFLADQGGVSVFVEAYRPHPWLAGIRLGSVAIQRSLPEFKSCSALASVFAERSARAAGFDSALLVDPNGIVSECAWANFFWFDADGVLRTRKENVLPGITRSLVQDLAIVEPGTLSLAEIRQGRCQAAFITQATSGVVRVLAVDTYEAFSVQAYSLVQRVQQAYDAAIQERSDMRTEFLTG